MSRFLSPDWRDKLLAAGFPPGELCTGEGEEILRRLPPKLGQKCLTLTSFGGVQWEVCYQTTERTGQEQPAKLGDTLSNVAAAMYCYLSDNKLLP